MTVSPYKNSENSKKEQIASMFNQIASRYDFLNHFLSLGIDKRWRCKAIKLLKKYSPSYVLDVATGTGDMAIALHRQLGSKVTGIDISSEMLKVGQQKIEKKNLGLINLIQADSESLPFDDHSFDAVTVAFGVRNFENLSKGLAEMARVLKPSGKMVILEFSKPSSFPFKQIYGLYFKYLLPFFGGIISKHKEAYDYLPKSVEAFPEKEQFLKELVNVGLEDVKQYRLTFGIATIYFSSKPVQ